MNDICFGLLEGLLRCSVTLSISTALVLLFLRIVPVASAKVRRLMWFAVVLQGCLLVRIPVTVPAVPYLTQTPQQNLRRELEFNLADEASTRLVDRTLFVGDVIRESITTKPSRFSWTLIAVVLWGLGMAVLVVRSAWYYLQFIKNLRPVAQTPREWFDEWNSLQRDTGVRRSATLYPSANVGPLLCWHPRGYRLIVPAAIWSVLERRQRQMILRHELAHIERGDIWKSFFVRLLALPQWFNPLAWWAVARFDDDAECACDEAICRANPQDAIAYARTLLQFGESRAAVCLTSQATGGHGLADRIRRLVVPNSRKDSSMKKMTIAAIVLGISTLHLLRFQTLAEDQPVQAQAPAQRTAAPVLTNQSEFSGFTISNLIVTGTALTSLPTSANRTEAVVNVGVLWNNLLEFQHQRRELKTRIAEQEMIAKDKQLKIHQLRNELTQATGDQAPSLKNQFNEALAAFENWKNEQSKEFLKQETAIGLRCYDQITTEIAAYSKEHGIRLVRKAAPTKNVVTATGLVNVNVVNYSTGSQQGTITFSATSGKGIPVSAASPNTFLVESSNSVVGIASNQPQVSTLNITEPVPSADAVILVANNTGTIQNHLHAVGLTGVTGTTLSNEPSDAEIAGGVNVIFSPQVVHQGKLSTVTADATMAPLQQMNSREVLYVEPGDEFDITQEILKRLNAKFEKEQASKSVK